MRFDGLQKSPAKADVTVEDLLGCPDGTVFGGEYKDEPNAWSGFCSADEGRKDVATSYYQHFTDCYYTFHGVRFLGMFNYFNREEIEWVPCTERGGIDEKGNMTKPIKVKIAFYNDNGPEGLPGDLIYSKVFDVIGEQTGVETMDGNIYAFNVDLGEDIKMEHGFMQINAIDENDESINCYLSLFKASTSQAMLSSRWIVVTAASPHGEPRCPAATASMATAALSPRRQ